jgi:hypothetical protein
MIFVRGVEEREKTKNNGTMWHMVYGTQKR